MELVMVHNSDLLIYSQVIADAMVVLIADAIILLWSKKFTNIGVKLKLLLTNWNLFLVLTSLYILGFENFYDIDASGRILINCNTYESQRKRILNPLAGYAYNYPVPWYMHMRTREGCSLGQRMLHY